MYYVLSIDQSTSGTKATVFDTDGKLCARSDIAHRRIVSGEGYISHDVREIYDNCIKAAAEVIKKSAVLPEKFIAVSISNQRETLAAWNGSTGEPVCDAVVWQCSRAAELCRGLSDYAQLIKSRTGLHFSPYFSAPKMAWILQNIAGAKELMDNGCLRFGTIDSWLIYKLTGEYKTDYSNASRTGLLNLKSLRWDPDIMQIYGVSASALPEIASSDSVFGKTDLEGLLPSKIPVCGVLGDSHAALFANGCTRHGMAKVTLGTGSSIMMNVGKKMTVPTNGVVASAAWGIESSADYVLEGNINYTGAVIKWLVNDVELIKSSSESGIIASGVESSNGVYLVPAFSGLGAPYWNDKARAILCGMNTSTKKAHIVRAAEESIAYQIRDVVEALEACSGTRISELYADGGPTHDKFLMQFLADMLSIPVIVSGIEELSAGGAAYMAIEALKYNRLTDILSRRKTLSFMPSLDSNKRERLYSGWKSAVKMLTAAN